MTFDWFTWAAQVVNFLILVWLLKRFLYGRIIEAMNAREAKIAARLNEAAQNRDEAQREAETFRAKNRDFEATRAQMLDEAKAELEQTRDSLLTALRKEVDHTRTQWFESLEREKNQLLDDFRDRLSRQIFGIARKTLQSLADATLEEQILSTFLKYLRDLPARERDILFDAVRESNWELEVRSAFPLEEGLQSKVSRSLENAIDGVAASATSRSAISFRFETDPDIMCGVELRARSHRLSWNVDSFLAGLEEGLLEGLEERARNNGKRD